jgi:hypothetical protein
MLPQAVAISHGAGTDGLFGKFIGVSSLQLCGAMARRPFRVALAIAATQ